MYALRTMVFSMLLGIICGVLHSPYSAEVNAMQEEKRNAKESLACRLVLDKAEATVGTLVSAHVEISNTSPVPIEIAYVSHPFSLLDLRVVDPKGRVISKRSYATIFSTIDEGTLILNPGQVYKHTVDITATSDAQDWLSPGTYTIRAEYRYNNKRYYSAEVKLKLTEK
jgi:hypothetical protein